jgi:uncharacterized membrane protein YwzB
MPFDEILPECPNILIFLSFIVASFWNRESPQLAEENKKSATSNMIVTFLLLTIAPSSFSQRYSNYKYI